MKRLLISLLFLLITPLAFSQNFVKEYTYNASENDSKTDARGFALIEVKKLLIEELGVYINSTTNLSINEQKKLNDVIYNSNTKTITEGITQTKILSESWDGEYYYIKVQIYVDKKDLLQRLKKISREENSNNNSGSKPTSTINTNSEDQFAFYGSIDIGVQQLNDDNFKKDDKSIMIGVKLGMLINKNIILGLYANINSEENYNDELGKYLRYSDGGLVFGARLLSKFPIQISIPIKLGLGGIKYFDDTWTIIEDDEDNYFVLEPGIELDLKLFKSLYLALGSSYKMTDAIVLKDTPNNILNGFALNLSFKLIINNF